MLFFLDIWSSPNLLGLVELASIMAEFTAAIVTETQYILKLTLELVSEDVMVSGQCHTCCFWTSPNMHMTIDIVQITPQFCFWSHFLPFFSDNFLF